MAPDRCLCVHLFVPGPRKPNRSACPHLSGNLSRETAMDFCLQKALILIRNVSRLLSQNSSSRPSNATRSGDGVDEICLWISSVEGRPSAILHRPPSLTTKVLSGSRLKLISMFPACPELFAHKSEIFGRKAPVSIGPGLSVGTLSSAGHRMTCNSPLAFPQRSLPGRLMLH